MTPQPDRCATEFQIWVPTLYGSSCVATLPSRAEAEAYSQQFGFNIAGSIREVDAAAPDERQQP